MRLLLVIAITLISAANGFGQHVALQSHYMFNGVALNPALTGSENAFSLIGSYRTQWVGFDGTPVTQSITAHAPLRNSSSSVGIQFYRDQIGVDAETGIYGSYAYKLKTGSKSHLSLGIAGGISFYRGNYSELFVHDNGDDLLYDTRFAPAPDFSFGAHYFTKNFFLTFSIPQFLTRKYQDFTVSVTNDFSQYNYLFGGGYKFELDRDKEIRPSALLKLKPGTDPQLDINLMGKFNEAFEAGVSYRTSDAFVLLFRINMNQQWSLMYSFGMPINSMVNYSLGSHEISLRRNFMYKTKNVSPRLLAW